MVRVAGVEESGDETRREETRQTRSGIVLELTVRYTRRSREKRVEWGTHFETIYAENQHCDARGHTRAVKGVGTETGMFV